VLRNESDHSRSRASTKMGTRAVAGPNESNPTQLVFTTELRPVPRTRRPFLISTPPEDSAKTRTTHQNPSERLLLPACQWRASRPFELDQPESWWQNRYAWFHRFHTVFATRRKRILFPSNREWRCFWHTFDFKSRPRQGREPDWDLHHSCRPLAKADGPADAECLGARTLRGEPELPTHTRDW